METLKLQFDTLPFLPAATLNELRRQAVEQLLERRLDYFHPNDKPFVANDIPYFEPQVDYHANIINDSAEAFYRRHQAPCTERGVEQSHDYGGKALMTCKYCLRYELGQCLKLKCNATVAPDYQGTLYLTNNGRRFRLQFNCQPCEMQVLAAEG